MPDATDATAGSPQSKDTRDEDDGMEVDQADQANDAGRHTRLDQSAAGNQLTSMDVDGHDGGAEATKQLPKHRATTASPTADRLAQLPKPRHRRKNPVRIRNTFGVHSSRVSVGDKSLYEKDQPEWELEEEYKKPIDAASKAPRTATNQSPRGNDSDQKQQSQAQQKQSPTSKADKRASNSDNNNGGQASAKTSKADDGTATSRVVAETIDMTTRSAEEPTMAMAAGVTVSGPTTRRTTHPGNNCGKNGRRHTAKAIKAREAAMATPGMKQLDKLIELAHLEVHQDTYRGVLDEMEASKRSRAADQNSGNNGRNHAMGSAHHVPWKDCRWGSAPFPPDNDWEHPAVPFKFDWDSDRMYMAKYLAQSACPCIELWTKACKQPADKKRKRKTSSDDPQAIHIPFCFTGRPDESDYRCVCDSNPFCLASLGGVMNNIIQERFRQITQTKRADKEIISIDNIESAQPTTMPMATDSEASVENVIPEAVPCTPIDSSPSSKSKKCVDAVATIVSSPDKTAGATITGTTTTSKLRHPDECPDWLNPYPPPLKTARPHHSKKQSGAMQAKPEAIFFRDNIPLVKTDHAGYSETTRQQLDATRRTLLVRTPQLRSYIYNVLHVPHTQELSSQSNGLTISEYVKKVTRWHESLLHPDLDIRLVREISNGGLRGDLDDPEHGADGNSAKDTESTCTRLSVPPGIQNLGATCYLNTQLQCLAQNPAFLEGVFTWRPPAPLPSVASASVSANEQQPVQIDPMIRVLVELQKLLAQLVHGGSETQSTLQFSNALGLEHGAQQDPNEFARLLFERMEHSFRECGRKATTAAADSETNDDGSDRPDLGDLLKNIFEGTTTYETMCLKCKTKSERSESFMDLNIPIEKRKASSGKGNGVLGSIGNKVKTAAADIRNYMTNTKKKEDKFDTDLQFCFNQTFQVETFDGDNQYHCGKCDSKQDAHRRVKLTKLPSVLNIQLSRYIFDRVTFAKKKVSDKVLLPVQLKVPYVDGEEREYLLCAVMRHQGSSAYSGHYVAEAMDWCTGRWFEFNDAIVKYLPHGPSCSYYSDQEDHSALEGSQDAYNMYYVDKLFLANQASRLVLRRDKLVHLCKQESPVESPTTETDNGSSVLVNVVKQRTQQYKLLADLWCHDNRRNNRLRRRETGIRMHIFPGPESFLDPSLTTQQRQQQQSNTTSYVWISSEFLREYCMFEASVDAKIRDQGVVIRHSPFMCTHGRLSPRTARRGKLITREQFDALVSLLQGERASIRDLDEHDIHKSEPVIDYVISNPKQLECAACVASYQFELSRRMKLTQRLKAAYLELEPTISQCDLDYDDANAPQTKEEEFAYVVHKKTVTKLRKLITVFLKSLVNVSETKVIRNHTNDRHAPEATCEGLDALDVSMFDFGQANSSSIDKIKDHDGGNGNHNNAATGGLDIPTLDETSDEIDIYVNRAITCKHGNLGTCNKNKVRYLTCQAWRTVAALFPNAIEHKLRRRNVDATEYIEEPAGCLECQAEATKHGNMTIDIEEWALGVKRNPLLRALHVGHSSEFHENLVLKGANNDTFHLVHATDIMHWRNAVNKLAKVGKLRAVGTGGLRSKVEELMFPNSHRTTLDFERGPADRLISSLHSLLCATHKQCIQAAIFAQNENKEEESMMRKLSPHVLVLPRDNYMKYIRSLVDLLKIIHGPADLSSSLPASDRPSSTKLDYYDAILENVQRLHPKLSLADSVDDSYCFTVDKHERMCHLLPTTCCDKVCYAEFIPHVGVGPSTAASGANGSKASDPIVVELDTFDVNIPAITDGSFSLRVFHIDENKTMQAAITSLEGVLGQVAPSQDSEGTEQPKTVRRSTRKRKSPSPGGVILNESSTRIHLDHNVAALRLRLYEACEIQLTGVRLIVIISNLPSLLSKTIHLDNSKTGVELRTLIAEVGLDATDESMVISDPESHIFLFRQAEKPSGKKKGDSNSSDSAEVWSALLTASNMDTVDGIRANDDRGSGAKKRRNKRSGERGFQGTLLSSSIPSAAPASAPASASASAPEQPKESAQADSPKTDASVPQPTNNPARVVSMSHAPRLHGVDAVVEIETESHQKEDTMQAMVIADDDASPSKVEAIATLTEYDENDELPPPVFQSRAKRDRSTQCHAVVVDDDNDDDDGSAKSQQAVQVEDDVVGNAPKREANKLVLALSEKLAELIGDDADKRKCFSAALWAHSSDKSKENVMELVGAAFDRYKEC